MPVWIRVTQIPVIGWYAAFRQLFDAFLNMTLLQIFPAHLSFNGSYASAAKNQVVRSPVKAPIELQATQSAMSALHPRRWTFVITQPPLPGT